MPMIVGILTADIHIPMVHSLKEKRRYLNAAKAKLSSSFNVSIAEVGEQDVWQRSVLAVAHVGVTKPVVDSVLARVVTMLENMSHLEVIHYNMELIA